MLRIGIVGIRRGSSFFGFNAFDGVGVTALCDLRPEALAEVGEAHDVPPERRFTDFNAMLDSGIDAVVISTPIAYHAEQAVAALSAGVHVLSEVTAADSVDECRALVAAARSSRAVYMFAENYCYRRPVVLVRKLVEAGLFGQVYYGEGEYVHNCRYLLRHPDGTLTWRGERRKTHTGVSYPTHSVGPLAKIFNDWPVSVQCLGTGSVSSPEFYQDDCCLGLVRTARGGLWKIRFDSHSLRPHSMAYYQVQGTGGCFEAGRGNGESDKIWLRDRCPDPNAWMPLAELEAEFLPPEWLEPPEAARRAGHGGGDYWELGDFVAAVRGERPPAITVDEAVSWTMVGLRSQESLESGGHPVAVDDPRAW